jgi:trehalose transport system substrate-binding protein
VRLLVRQAGKSQIKAYAGWRGPVRQANVLGGEMLGVPKRAPHPDLARELTRYLMSGPVQASLVSALGWPSFRSDAYGTIEPWQSPYFAAIQEALSHAQARPQVPNWAEVDRALSASFREIVYEGRPVQATLDRYHRQLQQAPKRPPR